MAKIKIGPSTKIYPMPALLVGANVDGKPNFMTVAWGGIVNFDPPMAAVAIRTSRHTHKGVSQNMTFSVNVPSTDLIKETDYCGITSGAKADKVAVCQFKVFYGKLGTAPLIEQCPINLECKVVHTLELGSHTLFVGKIEETHISEHCFTKGKLDINKIKPLAYISEPAQQYLALGEVLGKAFRIGLELK
jgi:flavin reductase (DIM6/NTAB) family NADH-FMN oxidoreductase RutF